MRTEPDTIRQNRFAPYERYAAVYDDIGQRSFGQRIAEATLAYLADRDSHPRLGVDLACGTGAATLVLAAAGIAMTGVDRSPAMLARAQSWSERMDLPVTWRESDIRDYCGAKPVELVTCFYDSLNYMILASDLSVVFGAVEQMLSPQGRFVFDLNTREKFNAVWNDSCYVAVNREDLFGVYQSWFEPQTGLSPLILSFFVKDADGRWDRFEEEHIERAYPLTEVEALLTGAGLEIEARLDYRDHAPRFGDPGSEQSHRIVYIAKPSPSKRSNAEP